MRLPRWRELFDVEPEEARLVGGLFATSFVLGLSLVLLRTGADTLFLVHFATEDLPYVFFATLALVPATGVLYNRLHERFGEASIAVLGLALVAIASAAAYPLLIGPASRPAAAFLRIFVEVANALAALGFWGPVASLLNLRQAKRLYPLIGTGEVVAGILGGVAVTPLVHVFSVEHLVLFSAATGAGGAAMLMALLAAYRRTSEEPEEKMPEGSQPQPGLLRAVLGDRYLLLIAASFVFYYVSYELLRYANVALVEARFEVDPAAMASFFGALAAVRTVLVLGVRTFASGRLIAQYGLSFGLLSLPVVQIAGAVALLSIALAGAAASLFWAVVVLVVIEEVVRTALNKPAVMVLYRPLTKARRSITQTVVETFVDPGATALVGVLILALGVLLGEASPATKVAGLAAMMLVALVGLLVVFLLIHREYASAVVEALSRGHLKSTRPSLNQPNAAEVAAAHLASDNAREVLYALRVLEKLVDGPWLVGTLERLLAHRNPDVRRGVLGLVERRRLGALREAVLERVGAEREPKVRGAMARAVAALEEDEAAESLAPLLEDGSAEVRRGAIEALLRYAGVPGAMVAGETLRVLAASEEPRHRIEAAEIVATVAGSGYTALLRKLLTDGNLEVRRAALEATGRTANLRLMPTLVGALEDRALRAAATRALVAAGPAALPSLGTLLAADGAATAAHAAEAIGRIGGADGLATLRKHLGHPVRAVRARILAGLRIGGYREPEAGVAEIHDRIAAEIEEAVVLAAARADLTSADGADLLRAALDRELARSRDFVLSLLSFAYPAQPILWAQRHLAGTDPDKRAYALEVIETLCPKRIRDSFFPLLERTDASEFLRRLRPANPPARLPAPARVVELAAGGFAGETTWLRTCARHAAATLEGDPFMLTVQRVILLKATDFFSTIDDDVLAEVATTLVEQTAAPGETVIEQGELDSSLFVIVSGLLRVHDGAAVLAHLGPGEVVGDFAALDPAVRSVSVTADEETLLLRMEHSTLMDLIEEHTEVAYGIIRFLVRRCRSATASVVRVSAEARDRLERT